MSSFAAPTSNEWNDILAGKNENTFVILKIEKKNISNLTQSLLSIRKQYLSIIDNQEDKLFVNDGNVKIHILKDHQVYILFHKQVYGLERKMKNLNM